MVTLNIVYLSAVVPLLVLTLLGYSIQDKSAKQSMLVGAGVSALCVLIDWIRAIHIPEATPLILAWPCALVAALRSRATITQIKSRCLSVQEHRQRSRG